MKIKFNTDDNLPLNKPLMLCMLAKIVRSVFEEDGKFYLQVYLDGCLFASFNFCKKITFVFAQYKNE